MTIALKYKWKRLLVHWRQWQYSLNDTINVEQPKISPNEEKGIKLWRICVRDINSNLSYNSSGVRHIEKDDLLMILHPSGNMYSVMTIIDINSEGKTLFELNIPKREASEICEYFDNELEKRMKKVENNKRKIIENDLDKLLKQNQ
jgi:hypothetical protein